MLRSRVIKGTALVSSGQIAGRACTFGRNVILARMLGPEDFGIGATFAITVAMLEMISDLSAGQLLIQAKDGDEPKHQYTAQTFTFVRGLVLAALILAGAPYLAQLFNVPEATWAFRWLALVPIIRGSFNLDVQRMQRDLRYTPDVTAFFLGELAAVLAAYPVAKIVGDYSAVLIVVCIQVSVWTVLTHVMANRRYRLGFDRPFFGRMLSFGWPLLIDGLLLFGAFMGDRVIVAQQYTPTDLGVYAVAISLSLTPTLVLARVAMAIGMPLMSRVQDEPERYLDRYRLLGEGLAIIGGTFGVSMILLGAPIVEFVYTPQFAPAGVLVAWLGAAQAFRILRFAPIIATMAKADTKATMFGNIGRLLGVAIALGMGLTGQPLWMIAASALAGEVCALLVLLRRLKTKHGVPMEPVLVPTALIAAALGTAVFLQGLESVRTNVWVAATAAGGLGTGFAGIVFAMSPRLRREAAHALLFVRNRTDRPDTADGESVE
jgi:O-antigen/teichoic acid export membrane protein